MSAASSDYVRNAMVSLRNIYESDKSNEVFICDSDQDEKEFRLYQQIDTGILHLNSSTAHKFRRIYFVYQSEPVGVKIDWGRCEDVSKDQERVIKALEYIFSSHVRISFPSSDTDSPNSESEDSAKRIDKTRFAYDLDLDGLRRVTQDQVRNTFRILKSASKEFVRVEGFGDTPSPTPSHQERHELNAATLESATTRDLSEPLTPLQFTPGSLDRSNMTSSAPPLVQQHHDPVNDGVALSFRDSFSTT